MVIFERRKRKTSEYSLDGVHFLAKAKQMIYGSPKVRRDIENLGFSLDAVGQCLQSLEERHYQDSINYDNKQGWFDVYKCSCFATPQSHLPDSLYIKLKLNRNCTSIILSSFHI